MRESVVWAVVFLSLSGAAFAVPQTQIRYEAVPLDGARWQYTYEVRNISLAAGIEEFTVWFKYGEYDKLTLVTPAPSGWGAIAWDPEPVLQDDGAYDAFTLSGLGVGQEVGGFSVTFDWLGSGSPGSQVYHIVDPDNYAEPIEIGYTIPEPATLFLLFLAMWFRKLRR